MVGQVFSVVFGVVVRYSNQCSSNMKYSVKWSKMIVSIFSESYWCGLTFSKMKNIISTIIAITKPLKVFLRNWLLTSHVTLVSYLYCELTMIWIRWISMDCKLVHLPDKLAVFYVEMASKMGVSAWVDSLNSSELAFD